MICISPRLICLGAAENLAERLPHPTTRSTHNKIGGVASFVGLLSVLLGAATVSAAEATGPFFAEDFNSAAPNANLFGYENFTVAGGVIRSNGMIADHNDRRYIRTVASDYNTRDFRFELTFTTTLINEVGIMYMGIGRGNKRTDQPGYGYNEPWESLYFRAHTPNIADGFIGIADSPVNDLVIVGDIPNGGTHRARIEKLGQAITFAIDRNYNGTFVADMSHTFPDITVVAPYLDPLNSRLFFGTALATDSFDNMVVAPIPEPTSVVGLAIGAMCVAVWGRRRG